MRVSNIFLLALPALAAAQDQVPLFDQAKHWFDRASSFVKSATANPGRTAAAKVAEHAVTPLSYENWKSVLQHSGTVKQNSPPEAWMVYVTGGNKTCRGRCGRADQAWNEAAVILSADPSAPKLASINCEEQELLCGAWGTPLANIWFWLVPQPAVNQSPAPTHITKHKLNITTVAASDITSIHTKKLYLEAPRYEGALHPIDGWVAKYGLTDAMAYGLYYFAKIPSWAFMIFLSLTSRYFVSKRMPPAGQRSQPAAAAPNTAAAPAAR